VELVSLDLSDLSSIRKCAEEIRKRYSTVDILVNNAGVSLNCPNLKKTKDGFEMHMGTNHLGHFLLTNLLLENIKKSSAGRIITVSSTTSVMSNIDMSDLMMERASGLGLGNTMPYNNSKFANSLFNKGLVKKLQGSRVKSYAVCPGLANSNIFRNYSTGGKIMTGLFLSVFGLPVSKAADIILYCALAKEIEGRSGKMFRFGKELTSVEPLYTDELAERLWEISEKLVGLKN
jgi:NAD(P)-dependent dehydrogenase (short-subunit alcohol dehydrogenase family)